MRNRGLSKIYLIAGLVMGVIVLVVVGRIVLLQVHPENQRTLGDPELRVPSVRPPLEQSGSTGGPNDLKQTEQSTSPSP